MAPISKKQAVQETSKAQTFSGLVVSTKMKDTVVVLIESYEKHTKYRKFMKRSKRFKAHDAGNTKKEGDKVTIQACAPISRDKRFRVIA